MKIKKRVLGQFKESFVEYIIDYMVSHFHLLWFLLLITILASCDIQINRLNDHDVIVKDSTSLWIEIAKDSDIDRSFRLSTLSKVDHYLRSNSKDSIESGTLLSLADIYYSLKEDSLFVEANEFAFQIAQKEKNIKNIAEYYWNKGNYYSNYEILDSAFLQYRKSYELYDSLNHDYYKSKMAYNMSYIQFRANNYTQSEIFLISAIDGFKRMGKNFNLYLCYNRLILLDKEKGDFKAALDHYDKASEYLSKDNRVGFNKEKLLNNLSLVYQKQKKYQLAIDALDKALENKSLRLKDPNLYAKLIDNRAYCQFLAGHPESVYDDFNRALTIRDSINNLAGVGISNMHLAEYHLSVGDTLRAQNNAMQANDLARSLGLNRDVLSSLVLLSRSDPLRANVYMDRYIRLNDSLLSNDRQLRNKFARIEFETEGYIAANEDLKKQNVWLTLTSVFAIASLGFLFFGYSQRSKNKRLILERQQQKANEDIYDLMLKQQNREEQGRLKERLRISEDLHDGVLARLFSVRMGLGFFQLAKNSKEVKRFDKFMKELQGVEKEIRSVSHALKNEELSSKKDFPKLLHELLREQSHLGGFKYSLELEGTIAWNLVDDKMKINLYRTVQEAIYNIIKYAGCTEVCVKLKRNKDQVELSIVDNGVGFDIKEKRKGIGLTNMRSRAESSGARIKIHSTPQKGTEIKLIITTKTLYHEPDS